MQEIRDVIEAKAAALGTGDVKLLKSYYAPQTLEFTLAPPLGARTDSSDAAPVERWLAGFERPPRREVTQLEITTDGDVAFATSIDSMTMAINGEAQERILWFRVTLGLRRIDGRWLVTHEHESVPFHMDGSLRAAVDLEP